MTFCETINVDILSSGQSVLRNTLIMVFSCVPPWLSIYAVIISFNIINIGQFYRVNSLKGFSENFPENAEGFRNTLA